jgi:hypothetical protein
MALILKRASVSRPSGEWSEDDYDVLADSAVVGRIMKAAAAPEGTPWLWTLAFGHHVGSHTDARLRADARGRDGCVREKLAAGMTAATLRPPRHICMGGEQCLLRTKWLQEFRTG